MPKITSRDLNDEWYACAQCGETTNLSLREHHRQVHQLECSLLYQGERERITVYRDSDGLWRCPRCAIEFAGSSRRIQEHARSGTCEGERPEDVETEDADEDSDSSLHDHKDEEEDEEDGENEKGAENMDIAAAVKATGLSESELADLVAWTKQKSARGSRRASVPEAIMALEAVASPKAATRSSDFQSDMPSHPPDWLATRHPLQAGDHTRANPGSKSDQKSKPYQRHAGKPSAAPIQAVVLQDAFAKTRRSTSLTQLQLPLESEISTSHNSSISAESIQQSQLSPSVRGGEPTAVPNAGSVLTAGFAVHDSTPSLPSHVSESVSGDPAIPSALKAFFGTVRVPLEHLAPIFVKSGLDTAEALDMLCTMSVGELDDLKREVIAEGRLVGWLAIRKALTERAQSLAI